MVSRDMIAGATRGLHFAHAQVPADNGADVATLNITAHGRHLGADRSRQWGEGVILQDTFGRSYTG